MTEAEQPERRFTVDEANALLAQITPALETLREAHEAMEERMESVMTSMPGNGGGSVHREFLDASKEAARAAGKVLGLGIILRDPATGLVDFPAERDGEEILLCWRLGEDDVGWWHPPDTGFAGRQPL